LIAEMPGANSLVAVGVFCAWRKPREQLGSEPDKTAAAVAGTLVKCATW
jgi:hypothetical protein